MSTDTLRLQTNVPETIALEFTDGLTVASKYCGDQIMFTLIDGRKMFLSPFVARRSRKRASRRASSSRSARRK